jgi:hypothetical protein
VSAQRLQLGPKIPPYHTWSAARRRLSARILRRRLSQVAGLSRSQTEASTGKRRMTILLKHSLWEARDAKRRFKSRNATWPSQSASLRLLPPPPLDPFRISRGTSLLVRPVFRLALLHQLPMLACHRMRLKRLLADFATTGVGTVCLVVTLLFRPMYLPGYSSKTTLVHLNRSGVAARFWTEGGDHGDPLS